MDVDEVRTVQDTVTLLDVREPAEWAAGHVEGSVHVPMYELASRASELPRQSTIVCVCRSGSRSAVVTDALRNAGFDAHNLDGGLLAWVESGHALTTADGGDGTVV